MLTEIKSKYILSQIFSSIITVNKLKLVLYNKLLISRLEISINNYQENSERILIKDSNNNIKEYSIYNDNNIIYEGDYLNNKRNGKGKEYDKDGILIYEGEFLNGKKNGKGKDYYYGDKIKFEGEYLNNKKWNGIGYNLTKNNIYEIKNGNGKITLYYSNGKLQFKGELINGYINGLGKEYYYNGRLFFEGNYINNKRYGKGKEYYSDKKLKIKFEGDFFNDIKWNGIEYDINGIKISEIKNGITYDNEGNIISEQNYNGIIKLYNKKKILIYEGKINKNGEKHGRGKEYKEDGELIFEGIYINGIKYKGKIKIYKGSLLVYEGEIMEGIKDGIGIFYYTDLNKPNKKYEGIFKKGKIYKGKEYNLTGEIIYEGTFDQNENRLNGIGKEYYSKGGILFEGEYYNTIKWNGKYYNKEQNEIYEIKEGNGFIKLYNQDGKILIFEGEIKEGKYYKGKKYFCSALIYDGEYLNGKYNGKGKEYNANIKGELIFEGEFLNGERNGKGKEYRKGEIIFDGEYIKGKRWNGKGKEYNYKGNVIFDGEYLNGVKNGKVKGYFYGDLIFEGEYLNGVKSGKGKEYSYKGDLLFDGEYLNGEKNGKGKEYSYKGEIIFEGEYLKGKKWNGKGKIYYDLLIFEGEILNGEKWNGKEYVYDKKNKLKKIFIYENGKQL